MRKPIMFLIFCCITGITFCQTATEIIARVKAAQERLSTASYRVTRQDTFVTGQTQRTTGEVKIKTLPSDAIFGFAYWGKRDDVNRESIYDGKSIFQIDHNKKSYESYSSASMIEHSLGSPGGQMVVPELVRLQTELAENVNVHEDNKYFYLAISLPDIKEFDVSKRVKTITIDKQLMLPVAVRSRQETLGKVQDLYWEISGLQLNGGSGSAYDFSSERVPAGYSRKVGVPNKKLNSLIGAAMPAFVTNDFNNKSIASTDLKGKLVLLDFWEVWCGPCVASMPKVQELEKKYADKGLAVYGMMSEKDQLEVAKLLVKKREISFSMLQSDEAINKMFGIYAVPTYVLIDREGIVRFTSEGFSEDIEKEIQRLL